VMQAWGRRPFCSKSLAVVLHSSDHWEGGNDTMLRHDYSNQNMSL
jgi:hypothetical protein